MNRIERTVYPEARYFANGLEVSHDVWCKAIEQNERLMRRRIRLEHSNFVRPWNRIRMQELSRMLEKRAASRIDGRSPKGKAGEGYGYAYRVDL